jgi:hypothetical protein
MRVRNAGVEVSTTHSDLDTIGTPKWQKLKAAKLGPPKLRKLFTQSVAIFDVERL